MKVNCILVKDNTLFLHVGSELVGIITVCGNLIVENEVLEFPDQYTALKWVTFDIT
jgi:hypothetical protein